MTVSIGLVISNCAARSGELSHHSDELYSAELSDHQSAELSDQLRFREQSDELFREQSDEFWRPSVELSEQCYNSKENLTVTDSDAFFGVTDSIMVLNS